MGSLAEETFSMHGFLLIPLFGGICSLVWFIELLSSLFLDYFIYYLGWLVLQPPRVSSTHFISKSFPLLWLLLPGSAGGWGGRKKRKKWEIQCRALRNGEKSSDQRAARHMRQGQTSLAKMMGWERGLWRARGPPYIQMHHLHACIPVILQLHPQSTLPAPGNGWGALWGP